MRDKILQGQIDALENNHIFPAIGFDGLRKVENLPKDIRKSSEDLYLPPIFSDKSKTMDSRPGVKVSVEENKYRLKPNYFPPSAPKYPQKRTDSGIEGLGILRSKVNALDQYNRYSESRNKHYKKVEFKLEPYARNPSASSLGSKLANHTRSYGALKPSNQSRYGHPSSAYTQKRSNYSPARRSNEPSNIRPTSNYRQFSKPRTSPYLQSFQEENQYSQRVAERVPMIPTYTPLTKNDFTVEALQQKKLALERLNERLRNL